ncbi:MAG: molybdopterin dinucleotide binding domain-containing protein, partial [Dehalococcoidales bacterium]|nr:molybdopterin dinucleotide binding domain-containing protein [Dehalococcoidales bacterium]
ADIILPTAMFLERTDAAFGVGVPFYGFVNKTIEPQGECRTHLDIARGLARKLGYTDFGSETEDELLRKDAAESEVTDYEEFKRQGVFRIKQTEPYVAFKKQIDDPSTNPFPTPSGKIEIYSKKLAGLNDSRNPPIAKYIETWEGRNDPLYQKYPLQLLTIHFKERAHTQSEKVPWLTELKPQQVHMNADDAKARGIKNGDMVRIFNDRGQMILPAQISQRIMPGVVDIPEGAWFNPDANGVDRGGCANVLTRDEASPGGAYAYNTALVEIRLEKAR